MLLELLHQQEYGFQQIHRLEATHDNRQGKVAHQSLVLLIAHDGAHVAGGNQALHTILW